MALSIKRLSANIGAEVSGIDLSASLDEERVLELRGLLRDHHVIFFRNQPLDPEQMLELAGRFGSPDVHAFGRHLPGLPQVGLLDQMDPEHDGDKLRRQQ